MNDIENDSKVVEKKHINFFDTLLYSIPYVLYYFLSLVYYELILYLAVNGNLHGYSLWITVFSLPPALLLSVLNGWFRKRRVNRLISVLILLPITVYYIVNLVYYGIFGSLLSLQLVGMGGQAIANFGKGIWGVVFNSIHWIILFLAPNIAGLIWIFVGKRSGKRTGHLSRLVLGFSTMIVWTLLVLLLPIGGTGELTAYYAYHSSDIDFDTATQRLGLMTNNVIELKNITVFSLKGDKQGDVPARETISDQTVPINIDELFGTTVPPVSSVFPETKNPDDSDESSAGISTGTNDTGGSDSSEYGTDPIVPPAPKNDPHVLPGMNFEAMVSKSSNKDIIEICNYLKNVSPTNRNDYTGLFKDYNLVYICAESFSPFAINEKVTPTLYRMTKGGIILNNYYTCFKNTTTNGEFAFLTGIWPDVSRYALKGTDVGSMPQSANKFMPTAFGNVFNTTGIQSLGYHNYKGSYYSRDKSWPNFGFSCKFMNAGLTITKWYWPSSDNQMTSQALNDLISKDRFISYFMTFSGHGPYDSTNIICKKNFEVTKNLLGPTTLPEQCIYYLAGEYEFDLALKTLIDGLSAAGKLDKTVFVITGDHAPYYLSSASIKAFLGRSYDTNIEYYKSTCIIWNSQMEDNPIVVNTPCCQIDILPTIYNLFDVDYDSRLFAGQDIFSSTTHMAILYNKNFITDRVKYNNSTGKATWLMDTTGIPADTLNAYIDACKTIVSQRYNVSLKMMDTDFYRFAFEQAKIIAGDGN